MDVRPPINFASAIVFRRRQNKGEWLSVGRMQATRRLHRTYYTAQRALAPKAHESNFPGIELTLKSA
jgi:hypothetical protein